MTYPTLALFIGMFTGIMIGKVISCNNSTWDFFTVLCVVASGFILIKETVETILGKEFW